MYEITCFDSDGNSIDYLMQYDINQTLEIRIYGKRDDYLKNPPVILFSNRNSKEARKVRSEVKGTDTIVAKIPNILLQDALPIFVSVYLTDSENDTSQKTILSDEIIVRKQHKPSDYYYVENITQITAQQIKREIKNELADDINESDISFTGITLWDEKKQRPYEIYVSDGKLMLEALNASETPLKSVTFTDRNDNDSRYKIYVYDGKLQMEKVY